MKKITVIITIFLILSFTLTVSANSDFNDVPKDHWAYEYVMELINLGVTKGIGDNNFGLGKTITRAEFTTFLCKLMNYELVNPATNTFTDVSKEAWYFTYIETALNNGVFSKQTDNFLPETPITREDIAVMLVSALGYSDLATEVNNLPLSFNDVTNNFGYITIAKDFGIITGISETQFSPKQTATREQAAVMMIKTYRLLNNNIDYLNGFYAIRSANQIDLMDKMDSISFGWCRLELNDNSTNINFNSSNSNEYNLPDGYVDPFEKAANKTRMLMIAVNDADSQKIINDAILRDSALQSISNVFDKDKKIEFDGIVLDFETLKGEETKNNYTNFIIALKNQLKLNNKLLFVAVHPQINNQTYFDGYDYKSIGEVADKIILMAHDYNAKTLSASEMEQGIVMTPLAPIDDVYYALKMITNDKTGVADKNKIMLQLNFATAQWKMKNGQVINSKPFTPAYDSLVDRINSGAQLSYSKKDESPYIKFANSEDGTDNIVWYEDERSIEAKLNLAKMFGIKNISLWRLGNIPNYNTENLNVYSILKK